MGREVGSNEVGGGIRCQTKSGVRGESGWTKSGNRSKVRKQAGSQEVGWSKSGNRLGRVKNYVDNNKTQGCKSVNWASPGSLFPGAPRETERLRQRLKQIPSGPEKRSFEPRNEAVEINLIPKPQPSGSNQKAPNPIGQVEHLSLSFMKNYPMSRHQICKQRPDQRMLHLT